jgi:TonB family protein
MKALLLGTISMLLLGGNLSAQSTESGISARLIKKPLQLRGFWTEDKLTFDADGRPSKAYRTGSFTESAFSARKVTLHGNELEIEGDRVGLVFSQDELEEDGSAVIDRVALSKGGGKNEIVKIRIMGSSSGDFTQALDNIFASSVAELEPNVPDYWKMFFRKKVLHDKSLPLVNSAQSSANDERLLKVGGSVQPPKLLKSVDPSFSEAARGTKTSGQTMVTFVVDRDGIPENIQVSQPAGVGLDEQAVKAVSQYRFRPAMRNGAPVKVELTVQVKFDIYD